MTTSLQLKVRLQPSSRSLADLQADLQSEEGQRQIAEDALATATLICNSRMTTSLQLKVRLQPSSRSWPICKLTCKSEEGQRQIAEDALATANADLQFANDNLFAACSEIAAKQQKL